MKTEDLVTKLLAYKESYYNGTPEISDEDFDAMEDHLRDSDPDNVYFSIVGTNIKGSNKIKHDKPMKSCAKAKTVEEVASWLKKIKKYDSLCAMGKVDGMSAEIIYVNNVISQISTRGDGEIGQDITYLKDYLNIPKTISNKERTTVRGEIYLNKSTSFKVEGKPLRNVAVGLVGRKSDKEDCKYLKFVAYYLDKASATMNAYLSDDLAELRILGFDVVYNQIIFDTELEEIKGIYLSSIRESLDYETDGLVIQVNSKTFYEEINNRWDNSHHNHYNIALKPPSIGGETLALDVEWTTSKHGWVNPVALLEPIKIGDRVVSRATLDNYGNVLNLKLAKGDIVFVTVRNDVIPHIEHVVKHDNGEQVLIDVCPSCGAVLKVVSKVDEIVTVLGVVKKEPVLYLKCENKDCPSQIIKTITDYCVRCEMDGVAESTVEKLYYDFGIHSIIELYSLKDQREQLLKIDGFGDSKVDNLLAQIEKSRKQTELQLISNLGIEGVHEKALIKLGVDSLEKWFNFKDTSSVNGTKLINFFQENKFFVYKMFEIIKPIKEIKMKTSDLGSVCMTGADPWKTGRKALSEKLVSMGYEPVDSINKDTNILVCEDVKGDSSKLTKARKLGIMIKSYEEFFK